MTVNFYRKKNVTIIKKTTLYRCHFFFRLFYYISFYFYYLKEIFFLGLGVILFGIVGALALASIESIPEDLIDNAAVLGALTLITALVFIADLLISPPRKKDKEEVRMGNDKADSGKLQAGKGLSSSV